MAEASVRAFFAVGLEEPLRAEAREVAERLRERVRAARRHTPRAVEARFANEEGWHVTLRFLGDLALPQVGELAARAREAVAAIAPFEIRLGRAITFPPRRPRVLALDVAPHEPLETMAMALDRAAVEGGLAGEARPFRAHVTLARSRGAGFRERDAEGVAAAGRARQWVRDVVLFESDLRPDGARYTPLERVALGEGGHP
ncbi:MAG: RNA 2',3'-cyclic phosphodiesterase [Myxococcota bacterium]|nr:RNA 2',3'-cyclic phosphodiesterase [Myxococcales bacterium]